MNSTDQKPARGNPSFRSTGRLAVLFLIGLLIVFTGGCTDNTVYEPVGYKQLNGRKVLFLQPSHQPPLTKELHDRIVDQVESRLAKSANYSGFVSRAEFLRSGSDNAGLLRDYKLFSETLAVVGVSERTLSRRVGQAHNAELLVMAQPIFIPCEFCETHNLLVVIGHVVDARSGEHRWRAHTRVSVGDPTPENMALAADELAELLVERIEDSFSPKWHQLRFDRLAATD